MILKIYTYFRNVRFTFNLVEIIIGLLALLLIMIVIKVLRRINREKDIDKSLREKRARIAQVICELENVKSSMAETETSTLVTSFEEQKASDDVPKVKRTRSMSMEERWAEYEKKRGKWHTA